MLNPILAEIGYVFIPKIANGFFGLVNLYKKIRKDNKKSRIVIWCDGDIVKRKNNTPKGLENAFINIWNFEDHLVLHLNKENVLEWQEICKELGHFNVPINSKEYHEHVRQFFPNYKKGVMPSEIILNKETIYRLFDNNSDIDIRFRSGIATLLSDIFKNTNL